ncbi:heat shock protein HspQ [Sphingopyxis witflariensis]|uniref:Heat shock protein HspQ n=1 Tax=Sphingopyxis witflariensis TaxID=173675 RepID=A0A246K7L2_9SPHN|nr:heat shock protein HspQ [Sphingopyxis witflariensis]OWR01294.1 DNA-binding protein [Sphingopyxis witflariensis]
MNAKPTTDFGDPIPPKAVTAPLVERARFAPGDIVRHRMFDFRGVIFDVDPVFANSDEWYEAIPEDIRPAKEQPYYHLLAENDDSSYIAYVSQQNLVVDPDGGPIDHPQVEVMFDGLGDGRYRVRAIHRH